MTLRKACTPNPEVYSWTAHQPVKSLVRAHLRMAVNKPPCVLAP